jgi:hypothetical protein
MFILDGYIWKLNNNNKPTTKKLNLDLDVFLHSITCLPIKDINKQFIFNLDDTNDIMFSLNNFLDFNLINTYYFKSHVFFCVVASKNT